MLKRLYVPLLTQITVPFLLLAVAIAAGSTYIVTRLIFDSVEDRFANQLIATSLLASEAIVRQEDELLSNVRLLSNIQGVDAALVNGEQNLLPLLILPAALNDDMQYVAVVNTAGSVVLSTVLDSAQQYQDFPLPADVFRRSFIQNVLAGLVDEAGDKYLDLVRFDGNSVLYISAPITDANSQVVGVMLVGRSMAWIANELREQTAAQISFYAPDGQLMGSTFRAPRALTSVESTRVIENQDQGVLMLPMSDTDVSYTEVLSPLEVRNGQGLGVIGVALTSSFIVQTEALNRNTTIIFILLTLFSVVIVGLLAARRITLPIRGLETAAQRVTQGDLKVRVPPAGQDEIGSLAQSFNEMVSSLSKSKQDLLAAYDGTIEGWAKATDLRDHETEGHSRRVTDLATALAQAMGVTGEDLVNLRRGALLHDIGKIAISDSILLKKGPLTPEERLAMQKHPVYARQFIEQIDFLKPAMDIPYSHHEKWDGSGYPRGLKGEQIPLAARLFAVVDVWDALTSDRPYRDALSFDDTLKHILKESGSHFDPKAVQAFKKMMGR